MMNSLLIATICAGLSGHADMCSKSLEAGQRQIGMYERVEQVEAKVVDAGKSAVGKKVYTALAYGAAGAQVGMGKSATVKMNGGALCDKITLTGAKKQGSIGLGWDF